MPRRKLPPIPARRRKWQPDGIYGSAGLVWSDPHALPVCAASTADGRTIMVTAATTHYFSSAAAAQALKPDAAATESLARTLGCRYVWGERGSLFSCLYRLTGRGISSELGTSVALQRVLASGRFRVKPTPTGRILEDALAGRVLL